MTNTYTERLENIIAEMKAALPETEYLLWLDFLRKVKPESELLDHDPKQCTDIREIMRLAEASRYPTWYIQPHCSGTGITLDYEQGELKNISEVKNVSKNIAGFSGTISGVSNDNQFIAFDIKNGMSFLHKMEFLEKALFTTVEYVLFPTGNIPAISSSKLEMSLKNFISKARESGLKVDGVVIISDSPHFSGNSRIIYKPDQE